MGDSFIHSMARHIRCHVISLPRRDGTGTSMITPIGAVVSVAALAAKDGVVAAAAAHKGKEVRILLSQRQQQSATTVAASEEDPLASNHCISLNFEGEGGE